MYFGDIIEFQFGVFVIEDMQLSCPRFTLQPRDSLPCAFICQQNSSLSGKTWKPNSFLELSCQIKIMSSQHTPLLDIPSKVLLMCNVAHIFPSYLLGAHYLAFMSSLLNKNSFVSSCALQLMSKSFIDEFIYITCIVAPVFPSQIQELNLQLSRAPC